MLEANNYDGSKRIDKLNQLLSYLNQSDLDNMIKCAYDLARKLGSPENISNKCVLVAYGGGKDSTYMLAYVRIIQLFLYKEMNQTFKMRIVTYRHCGVTPATTQNIHNAYSALGLYNDPSVEMLLFDEEEISCFDKDKPFPLEAKNKNRRNVLITGHLVQGDGRPTFCNACNFGYINSLISACFYNNSNADIFITGDSNEELIEYSRWVGKISHEILNESEYNQTKLNGFGGYQAVKEISGFYFAEIYGNKPASNTSHLYKQSDTAPQVFSIYKYTNYASGDHWDFLTNYLGFNFDDLAFSFTESDCANPALMAHIRGLKALYLHKRNYEDGIMDYLQFAVKLMQTKQIPAHLILKAKERYLRNPGMQAMREKIQRFAEEAFGISEQNLVCMVFSPFINQGMRLKWFIKQEHPHLLPHFNAIHKMLANRKKQAEDSFYEQILTEISGLDFSDLCTLYHNLTNNSETILNKILAGDPHKMLIETRHSKHGPIVKELISGR